MHESYTITNDTDGDVGNRWTLTVSFGDQGEMICLPMGVNEVTQLYEAMEKEGIVEYIKEFRWHQREWNRMNPAERAAALGEETDSETGYALDDPKHPTWLDRMTGDA